MGMPLNRQQVFFCSTVVYSELEKYLLDLSVSATTNESFVSLNLRRPVLQQQKSYYIGPGIRYHQREYNDDLPVTILEQVASS